jgi:hypothetical protein
MWVKLPRTERSAIGLAAYPQMSPEADARGPRRAYLRRMVTAKTLKYLAALTAVLFAISALIGSDRDVLWIVDDIVFFALLLSAVLLVVLTVAVLVRGLRSSRHAES